MESSIEKVGRLVSALEALSDQEFCSLNAGDHAGTIAIQSRCQPVIDEISRLMAEPGLRRLLDTPLRVRVEQWSKNQIARLERLSAAKAATQEELQTLRAAQSRTHLFRSAYGRNDAGLSPPTKYAETG